MEAFLYLGRFRWSENVALPPHTTQVIRQDLPCETQDLIVS